VEKKIERNNVNENNMVKTPNWHKADQFAIYRHGSGIELMTTESNTS